MRILHLEDEGPLRDILRIALTSVDPKVEMTQFINSDEAVTYIEKNVNDIDLYILDIRVPGKLNGLELAQKIRALGSKGRIVMTSAYRRPSKEQLTELKSEWMAKPWHILNAPEQLLGHKPI